MAQIWLAVGLSVAVQLACIGLAVAQAPTFGQKTAPIAGGMGIAAKPANPFLGMSGTYAPTHKTPDGRACIAVTPMTHPQIINPKIIDQIVLVNNICGQSIKVQICYAGSTDCIIVPLTGYQRVQRILGVASGSTVFRYEYSELY
ncbi:hypothetical protein JQ615_17365 [Bradyrhizobium jicamae]|uniref:Uncharacterized protein n=1 Tax=Bradyrhizobium jicamae TaxID=280332 RepID=A0ABS5FK59_9BRAD|nr:hypothetical protein [Bradyrhizobium jicamae]MBR0797164.1 hypothetical protein [Bradyrhizobium jicamae]MBR0934923.1 hypothetical protein [Bradyrhizobium jicamae]